MRRAAYLSLLLTVACEAPPCDNPTQNTLGELTDWERAYLEGPSPSVPPPGFVEAEDGLPLAYHDWIPTDWDASGASCLIVPGSSAYAELYAALGEGLAARGVFTRIIDVRGHGRSVCSEDGDCSAPPATGYDSPEDGRYWVGRPGDSLDENQIIRDLARHVATLRQLHPQARLVVAGHSSGAGVISRFVEHGGLPSVDSVALLAPFNHADQSQNIDVSDQLCPDTVGSLYAQVDLAKLGEALRGEVHRYVLHFVKEEELTAELDTLRYSYTTMVGMAASDPQAFEASYVEPLLWVAAEDDAIMSLDRSRETFERLPGGGAFVTLGDTSHVGLSWSDTVAGLLADWAVDPAAVQSGELGP